MQRLSLWYRNSDIRYTPSFVFCCVQYNSYHIHTFFALFLFIYSLFMHQNKSFIHTCLWLCARLYFWKLENFISTRYGNKTIKQYNSYFRCCQPEQAGKRKFVFSVVWHAMMLMQHHCNDRLRVNFTRVYLDPGYWVISYKTGVVTIASVINHDDVIKWKHFPRYWPFVRGIPLTKVSDTRL